MISAGALRHRILIEDVTVTPDTAGDPVETWDRFAKVWAAIAPLSGNALIAAQAVQSNVSVRITIRALPGLLPRMRIIYRGKIYNIAAILPDKDSGLKYVTLPCSEGVNEG